MGVLFVFGVAAVFTMLCIIAGALLEGSTQAVKTKNSRAIRVYDFTLALYGSILISISIYSLVPGLAYQSLANSALEVTWHGKGSVLLLICQLAPAFFLALGAFMLYLGTAHYIKKSRPN
jgi:hypothetical protein